MPRQVREREEAVVEEEVALDEPRVAGVGQAAPAKGVVPNVEDEERQPSGDDAHERGAERRIATAGDEQRDGPRCRGYGNAGERQHADCLPDAPAAPAARGTQESEAR